MMNNLEAYTEGVNAILEGVGKNPYLVGTPEYLGWEEGFLIGKFN